MKRIGVLLFAAAVCAAVAGGIGGTDAFGRALLSLGAPRLASALLSDPALRGAALHEAGRHREAAAAFEAAGRAYNLGVAAAWAGDYAAALAAWDEVLTETPDDKWAGENYELVTRLFAGTEFDIDGPLVTEDRGDGPTLMAPEAQGDTRAMSTGSDATNTTAGFVLTKIKSAGPLPVKKVFDAQRLRASERWLTTLTDQPGLFLQARLAEEQAAREAAGTALPPAEDAR